MTHTPQQPQQESTARPQKALPRDTNAAIRDVMGTIEKLGRVYSEEIKALSKSDSNAFFALQDNKISAAQEYENAITQMIARKNELTQADPTLRKDLQDLYDDFNALSEKNLEALNRMHRCTERLGNTIRNSVIKSARARSAYSYEENGALSNNAQRRVISSGLSETV